MELCFSVLMHKIATFCPKRYWYSVLRELSLLNTSHAMNKIHHFKTNPLFCFSFRYANISEKKPLLPPFGAY